MTRRVVAATVLWSVTVAAVITEFVYAFDGDPDTLPWTDYLIRLPWIPLVALSTGFGAWLVVHLVTEKRKKERRQT